MISLSYSLHVYHSNHINHSSKTKVSILCLFTRRSRLLVSSLRVQLVEQEFKCTMRLPPEGYFGAEGVQFTGANGCNEGCYPILQV